MNLNDLLIMRHELLLTLLAVIILVLDLGVSPKHKDLILPVSIVLFFIKSTWKTLLGSSNSGKEVWSFTEDLSVL